MAVTARIQVGYWRDTQSLFTHAVAVTDRNWVAHLGLGNVAFARGDRLTAFEQYTAANDDQPGNAKILNGIGQCWLASDPTRAIPYLPQAVKIQPSNADYHVNLAAALTARGDQAALSTAADQLRAALRLDPTDSRARVGLTDVLNRLGSRKVGN